MENLKDGDFTAQAESILQRYPREQRFALAMMQDFQKEYDYLPREAIRRIAGYLEVPPGKIYSLATFYKAISMEKKGKYIIKVCDGTCHIRSSTIIERSESCWGLNRVAPAPTEGFPGNGECLGTCALPVMVINEEYFGSLTVGKVKKILQRYGGRADEE